MIALTGINSMVASFRAVGRRIQVVHRRQMRGPPAQTIRKFFECAAIANPHMANAAK
jgi:hypothetical protein